MWYLMHFLDLQQLDRWPNGWGRQCNSLSYYFRKHMSKIAKVLTNLKICSFCANSKVLILPDRQSIF